MWENWSGSVRAAPTSVARPQSEAAIAALLRDAAAAGKTVRCVGSGHSFTPIAAGDDVMLSLDAYQGFTHINGPGTQARLKAGTKLFEIGPGLAVNGLAMENLGDINVQSLAGATSTGTHGTGATLGNLATQIDAFSLVTVAGDVLHASPTENPELFAGGRVALGTLGVLSEITIRLVPAYRLHLRRAPMNFDDCLAQAPAKIAEHRSFEFFWFPHTDTVQTKSWDLTHEPAAAAGFQRYFTEVLLENTIFGALCRIGKAFPRYCPAVAGVMAKSLDSTSRVDDNFSVLSTVRNVKFNEMEWALPADEGLGALREIKEFVNRTRVQTIFPVEVRWVKGDDIWLSPHYGRDSIAISVHQYQGMEYGAYFDAVQAIARNHQGRPHWGKIHGLRGKDLQELYPRWNDFMTLRERLDPRGTLLSPYLRALLGVA